MTFQNHVRGQENTVRKIIFKYMIKSTRIQHFIQENISSLSNKSSILHQIMNGM